MSIRFYDEALYNKIKKWVKDPKMRILKPNESKRLFEIRSNQTDDKPLELPIIAISRSNDVEILNTKKTLMSFDGILVGKNDTTRKIFKLNAIPIKLEYEINIYTRYFDECDEYIRNFVFQLINHPRMKVEIPYNGYNGEHVCSIALDSNISDTSNVSEHLFSDQFSVWTLKFSINDAYMFSTPLLAEQTISEAELEVRDKSGIVMKESIDLDD